MGYKILVDRRTKTYYMESYKPMFRVYSEDYECDLLDDSKVLVETDIYSIYDLDTMLYNAGFQKGYLNDEYHVISKPNLIYTDRNNNEILYAQYLLTNDKEYLSLMNQKKLYTLVKISPDNRLLFPLSNKDGKRAIECFTDISRINNEFYQKYSDYTTIYVGQSIEKINLVHINNRIYLPTI